QPQFDQTVRDVTPDRALSEGLPVAPEAVLAQRHDVGLRPYVRISTHTPPLLVSALRDRDATQTSGGADSCGIVSPTKARQLFANGRETMKLAKPAVKEFAGIIAATLVTGIAVQISGTHSAPAAPVHAAGAG